jgi:spermidine synthase
VFQAAPAGSGALRSALGLGFSVVGPALLAAGGLLPSVLAAAGAAGGAPAAQLGRLLAVNTLGAIAGALFAPFVLLAWLSPFAACAAVAVLYAAAALFVPMPSRELRLARDTVLGLGWLLLLGAANPLSYPLVRVAPGEEVRHVSSGPGGVVAVMARGDDLVLRTDNHQSLAGSADRVHQERQGWVAHLLHPRARRVAWIGSATGISAGPFTTAPLQELALVEITPAVSESAAHFFAEWNRGVHHAPFTRVVQDDARNFLRATSSRYDLIVADLFVPWIAGTGSLYTQEHFDAVRAHLNADGVFVQWLPLYQLDEASLLSIVATFVDAFPCSSLWRGDFFGRFPIVALVGCTGRPPDPAEIARAAEALRALEVTEDRWVTDPVAVFALYAGPLSPLKPALKDVPRNTDDEPVVELTSARSGIGAGNLQAAYTGPRLVTFVAGLREAATRDGDGFLPQLSEESRHASEAGELLQAASTAYVSGNAAASSALLRSASERIPGAVLDPARPDPTAAEVWGTASEMRAPAAR